MAVERCRQEIKDKRAAVRRARADFWSYVRQLSPRRRRAVVICVSVTGLFLIGWLSGVFAAGFNWTRKGENAGAVQAITAVAALLATLTLLGVTWWQARLAREATAEQLRQASAAASAAWEGVFLSEKAAAAARAEANQARRDEEKRAKLAARPMLVWREVEIVPTPGNAIDRLAFAVRNAGAGPAVTAHLSVGSGGNPKSSDLGFFTLGSGEDMSAEVELPGIDKNNRLHRPDITLASLHGIDGILLAQLFAAYEDIYGNRYGSRVEVYYEAQHRKLILGPVVFQEIDRLGYTIDALRNARVRRPK